MAAGYCCDDLREQVEFRCEDHPDPYDCADNLVIKTERGYFGLIIHDGGSSHLVIQFFPWCGSRLPSPPEERRGAAMSGWWPRAEPLHS